MRKYGEKLYPLVMAAGAVTILNIAFTNCTKFHAPDEVNSISLPSSSCSVDSTKTVTKEIIDGDFHTELLIPVDEAGQASEKLYLNDQGDPTLAPRWEQNTINWYYNPANAPASVQATALDTIKSSIAAWTSVCGVKFNYMGETDQDGSKFTRDGMNVIAWGDAGGATGVAYNYVRYDVFPYELYESDLNFNIADVDSTVLIRGVANHEVGHMLGLGHSDVQQSIMFASPYNALQYLLTLRPDDIAGCVELYGPPGGIQPVPTPTPAATPMPVPGGTIPAPGGSQGQGC